MKHSIITVEIRYTGEERPTGNMDEEAKRILATLPAGQDWVRSQSSRQHDTVGFTDTHVFREIIHMVTKREEGLQRKLAIARAMASIALQSERLPEAVRDCLKGIKDITP